MSKRHFTEEQIAQLRKNPYVYNVTESRLLLTKEFKEIFVAEYDRGELPRKILENHGFDIAILGERRVWSISDHIRAEYKKYGDFHSGYRRSYDSIVTANADSADKPKSDNDEIKQLRHEVEYMKQEIEFLKKISSIKHTQK